MQIQHKGYFNVNNAKSSIKSYFKSLGYSDSFESKGVNPLNEERIDIIVGEGFYSVEFRKDDIQIYDKCPDFDTADLENNLQRLGDDGLLISLVFEKLTTIANYEYLGIRQQNETAIIINFKKDDLRGYINLQKSKNLVALTYTSLSPDEDKDETFEEKSLKQNLELTTREVNNILNTSKDNKS